jgi:SH3-like domain-containing protein
MGSIKRTLMTFVTGVCVIAPALTFADFRQTTEAATIGFEGPSAKATRQFIYSRGTPLEIVVTIEGWYKVRDAQGELVWIERKAVAERTNVQVGANAADVHAAPDAASPILFRADSGVLLQLIAPPSAATGLYAQVKHRDGTIGFVRIDTVFGL